MSTLLLAALIVAGVVVLTPVADRLRVPLPVLLTVYGLVLPFVPGAPALDIDPELILPVVLPPLLFAATQRSTAREFRSQARPILVLAVGLTVATAAAAAVLAHLLGLGWGPAAVLGAVVAPPDPVAATAVARRLRLPDRVVTVLEGEGMFNDATALVLYSLAVGAVVTGDLTARDVSLRLLLAVLGGLAVGLAAGVLARLALAALHDGSAETTVTVVVPFVAYLAAEQVEGSGVLAVLAVGLYLRTYAHPATTAGGYLLGRSVWGFLDYLITSVVFVLIGFELTDVLEGSPLPAGALRLALATVLLLVAVRFLWMFPAVAVARVRQRRGGTTPYGTPETVVVAWAGMRGVVTIATALALPLAVDAGDRFPERDTIVVVGLVTVLATLVVQGLTLSPLVKRLGVGSDADPEREVAELRRRATQAALQVLDEADRESEVAEPVRQAVRLQYEGYLAAQDALAGARHRSRHADGEAMSQDLGALQRRAAEAERELVLTARRRGEVSADVADEVLSDVETRAVRDLD